MTIWGTFPTARPRRLRSNPNIRAIVAENRVSVQDLIWPIFLCDGAGVTDPVPTMPGVNRLSIDNAVEAAKDAARLGIPAIALFPYTDPDLRDETGSEGLNADNLVCRAVRAVRKSCPDLVIVCDVALDPYTSHGHDGLLRDGTILNDETLEVLVTQALVQAEAGCDTLAPSDMMDGRVGAIRTALDDAGYGDVRILSYAAKYASCFYGPFRDAVGSSGTLIGDKRTYQMDPANGDEAIKEVGLDIQEGADMVMVKPGMPYLDIIRRVKDSFHIPTIAYQVSGEYAMLNAYLGNDTSFRARGITEVFQCFKRAGSDAILSYFAHEFARDANKH